MENIIIVGIGGFIGSNLRFLTSKMMVSALGTSFPYGTLFVNVAGGFILGFVMLWTTEIVDADPRIRLFIGTGMIGALTTFSTFSVETINMIRESNYVLAASNTALNLVLSFAAVIAGFAAARLIA